MALIVPLPLPLHLALTLYSTAVVRSNGSLCRTNLLTSPLTVSRVSTFHHWAARLASLGERAPPVGT